MPAFAAAQTSAGTGGTVVPAAGAASLQAGPGVLLGRRQKATGTVPGTRAGDAIAIQRSDRAKGWVTLATGKAAAGGAFTILWRADRSGRYRLRAIAPGRAQPAQTGGTQAPEVPVTVYATSIASEYGPVGNKPGETACGVPLTKTTVGVAHKTLPCGTLVEFYYRGRTVTAPVIDRGPFIAGREWDLTFATAQALRFAGLDRVGAVRVGRTNLSALR